MSMISELVDKLMKYAAEYDLPPFGREIDGTKELLKEAADTIESLSTKLQAANMERSERYYSGGWIPCKDRLPGITGKYIVCKKDSIFSFIADFVQGQGANYWSGEFEEDIKDIAYWTPLPEPYHEP